ncbi:MAG: response regulator transcription factor [Bacteroidetes bacterium]|jgi:DNA-binding response OmpR family regulator|nr:response regulator transcription factor [Bacteroidota bacterium]MBT6685687.1 response regulator transcription factor [Bacteroidota bacterium]MBT7141911.1 response regulator transcription factor [Bacteroidota bacterium]MBT7493045.1 response regulator transcription factor [Bacteroidota bacterium]
MRENIRVLLVEDDENLGSLLCDYLKAKGFLTELFTDGEKGYKAFMKNHYDICVLDVMMPKKDGYSLSNDIRSVNSQIPIIFLTAKSLKEDVLKGFSVGADDYIKKPFNMEELLVRIQALLKRVEKSEPESNNNVFQIGKFTFDSNIRQLTIDGETSKLTTKESGLLKLLCSKTNEILERNYALQTIWKDDTYFNARSMDVYITKLRKHLKQDPSIEIINIHGEGYKLLVHK